MHTTSKLLWLALTLFSLSARADSFYEFVRYKCDSKNNLIEVELLGAYNEAGIALAKSKDENTWNPWDLVSTEGSDRYIKKTKKIEKSCALSDGTYSVQIGPNPCNSDIQGLNGAMMMAWAKITKDGKQLAHTNFGACGVDDVKVTTKLQVKPGQKPTTEQKSGDDYFR